MPAGQGTTCASCLSWGEFAGLSCRACLSFDRTHQPGSCASCARTVSLKKAHCRLCWMQASADRDVVGVLQPFLDAICSHQLRLAGMQRIRTKGPPIGKQGRRAATRAPPIQVQVVEALGWQPRLIDVPKDFLRFDRRRHANLSNPFLAQARRSATRISEARGWSKRLIECVDRALVIVLSDHALGDTVSYSELFPVIRRYKLSIARTVEVLDDVGIFHDDRIDSFEAWMASKLTDVSPGIRSDVEDWVRTLREGSHRSAPRSIDTVWGYLNSARPILNDWSTRCEHLREVTRDDIDEAIIDLKGERRRHTTTVMRSLFRHCKKTGTIFQNPTTHTHVGKQEDGIILPLNPVEIKRTLAAITTPAARLTVALAAIHAARTSAICELRLDDIDIGNRRLAIGGRVRPLDDLTRQTIVTWLNYRRHRWPNTANKHLIMNAHTAVENGPVSKVSMTAPFRGQTATIERLRIDRQLEEALHHGPDPLHLATIFDLDPKTAIRYSNAARQLLEPLDDNTGTK